LWWCVLSGRWGKDKREEMEEKERKEE